MITTNKKETAPRATSRNPRVRKYEISIGTLLVILVTILIIPGQDRSQASMMAQNHLDFSTPDAFETHESVTNTYLNFDGYLDSKLTEDTLITDGGTLEGSTDLNYALSTDSSESNLVSGGDETVDPIVAALIAEMEASLAALQIATTELTQISDPADREKAIYLWNLLHNSVQSKLNTLFNKYPDASDDLAPVMEDIRLQFRLATE